MCVVYPQKGIPFVQWPNTAMLNTGSGSGNNLFARLEISPFLMNIHIYSGNQSIPAEIVTAQKQMNITVLQVPF